MPRSWVFPIVCALVAIGAGSLRAQTDTSATVIRRRPPPSAGAIVGYSRSRLHGPEAAQLQSRQGSVTGVYLVAPITRGLIFRPELLFSIKGGRTQSGTVILDIELAYLEMPMLAKLVMTRGRVRPILYGGPAPAFQIGCAVQFVAGDQSSRATCGEDVFSLFRSFDIGIAAGGGVEFRWPGSGSALALEARYTVGLRPIISESDVRNRTFGVLLALTF